MITNPVRTREEHEVLHSETVLAVVEEEHKEEVE
jgi:hypothetical protein